MSESQTFVPTNQFSVSEVLEEEGVSTTVIVGATVGSVVIGGAAAAGLLVLLKRKGGVDSVANGMEMPNLDLSIDSSEASDGVHVSDDYDDDDDVLTGRIWLTAVRSLLGWNDAEEPGEPFVID
jgi:hypothetical protein